MRRSPPPAFSNYFKHCIRPISRLVAIIILKGERLLNSHVAVRTFQSCSSARLHVPDTNLSFGFQSVRVAAPLSLELFLFLHSFISIRGFILNASQTRLIAFNNPLAANPAAPLIHLHVNDYGAIQMFYLLYWRHGVAVAALGVSTKLLYVEPGDYWDG